MNRYVFLLVAFIAIHNSSNAQQLPFRDTALSFDARVNDLAGRLTLEEKVAQMLNAAPAVPRLNIPAYDWWNEVLHGVARTPYHVTVYPQAIALAATFDTAALRLMASYSADEGRAIYNKSRREGHEGQRYQGLTYWTPNINIFRDPRWGRGQETYGEDPYLTAMMGTAFVNGLQGNDPRYLKAAACAKHYAVHSGPEPERHQFNVDPSDEDLWNTYLPAFRQLVTKARVAGVMCAYNAFRTQPCCGSDVLMTEILRKRWQFTGYVTSDCGAIDDFYERHKTHPSAEAAAADAVLHGTDVECGNRTYRTLVQAVKDGTITEAQIDESVKRLFLIRFRLGMFDPETAVPFARIPESVLESAPHRAQSLRMAREAIVLLRNEGAVLPLKKNLRKVVVLGPDADNPIAVLGNYNGTPSKVVTALQGIRDKLGPGVQVVYEKSVGFTNDTLLQYGAVPGRWMWQGQAGFHADYYNNTSLKDAPVASFGVPAVDFDWSEGQSVAPGVNTDHFSARYSADLVADRRDTITFEAEGDDGYRLLIDGKEAINAWTRNRWGARTYHLATEEDKTYRIVLEYYQSGGNASIHLRTGHMAKTDARALARRVQDADALIFVGGISPQLEGEEMKVNEPGFNGGDRTSIALPQVQTDLLKALQATGKPLVFVLMTGSAVALPWEAEHVPAIVNAWYGGAYAGTAIADVLFGDYNPAGRLPVTFYRSDSDLPSFNDYSMKGRTYRYFGGQALYPFGYGLSYTRFTYEGLHIKPVADDGGADVSVTVRNSGNRDGDEVAQLYVSLPDGANVPLRSLKGFRRIPLKKGESRKVIFHLTPEDLSLFDGQGNLQKRQKRITVTVGGGQPDASGLREKRAVQGTID